MSFLRSANGSQVPDPKKFPNGFKAVADFIHGLGMKSGLYTAKGPHTCQKRAASCRHEAQDAALWASWGIDYVKDGASSAVLAASEPSPSQQWLLPPRADSCSTCSGNTDMQDYHHVRLTVPASPRDCTCGCGWR
eukprot:COSAG01_NODE_18840_length_1049_cov_2.064211_2_plen_135_part_00